MRKERAGRWRGAVGVGKALDAGDGQESELLHVWQCGGVCLETHLLKGSWGFQGMYVLQGCDFFAGPIVASERRARMSAAEEMATWWAERPAEVVSALEAIRRGSGSSAKP